MRFAWLLTDEKVGALTYEVGEPAFWKGLGCDGFHSTGSGQLCSAGRKLRFES
jgi:hypothetical protein